MQGAQAGTVMRSLGRGAGNNERAGTCSTVVAGRIPQRAHNGVRIRFATSHRRAKIGKERRFVHSASRTQRCSHRSPLATAFCEHRSFRLLRPSKSTHHFNDTREVCPLEGQTDSKPSQWRLAPPNQGPCLAHRRSMTAVYIIKGAICGASGVVRRGIRRQMSCIWGPRSLHSPKGPQKSPHGRIFRQ